MAVQGQTFRLVHRLHLVQVRVDRGAPIGNAVGVHELVGLQLRSGQVRYPLGKGEENGNKVSMYDYSGKVSYPGFLLLHPLYSEDIRCGLYVRDFRLYVLRIELN